MVTGGVIIGLKSAVNDIGPCYFLNCRLKLKKLNISPPNLKLGYMRVILWQWIHPKPKIKVGPGNILNALW